MKNNSDTKLNKKITKYCLEKINEEEVDKNDSQLIFRTCAFIIWENSLTKN